MKKYLFILLIAVLLFLTMTQTFASQNLTAGNEEPITQSFLNSNENKTDLHNDTSELKTDVSLLKNSIVPKSLMIII